MDIKSLVRPNVRTLKAYEAKEIPCRVKLDANESPYGFPYIKGIATNRYPDPAASELKSAFSKTVGVRPSNVLVGNGSDELIYYLITTFGGPVLYPTPTFSMYGIIAKAIGEKTVEVPLDGFFDTDIERMIKAIKKERPKLVFLSTPNNPTGNCFSAEKVLKIIEASKGMVVVDEAYMPFSGGGGYAPFLKDYRNLLIMRTLSKIGLAALRVGFLIGDEAIIGEVNKVRLPFNVNSVSQSLAVKSLKDKKSMRSFIGEIVRERDRLFKEMSAVKGIEVHPSEANFILFHVKDADKVHAGLLTRGILVRNMRGVVDSCLRVTVGTRDENNAFLKALKEVVR
jgi:histidinol-phosphate aminotransferase